MVAKNSTQNQAERDQKSKAANKPPTLTSHLKLLIASLASLLAVTTQASPPPPPPTAPISATVTKAWSVPGKVEVAAVTNNFMISESSGRLRYDIFDPAVTPSATELSSDQNDGNDKSRLLQQQQVLIKPTLSAVVYPTGPTETLVVILAITAVENKHAVLVGGTSKKVILAGFMPPNGLGKVLRTWELTLDWKDPILIAIKQIPDTNYYMTSCDNKTMFVIDPNQDSFAKPPHNHNIDLVKELAVAKQLYITSGIQMDIAMNDWTTGSLIRVFSTISLDKNAGKHRVNGMDFLDLENGRTWFAIGLDNSIVYIYDSALHSTVNIMVDPLKNTIIDLIYYKESNYVVTNSYVGIMIYDVLKGPDAVYKFDSFPGLATSKVVEYKGEILLGTNFGHVYAIDLGNHACHFSCAKCSKSSSETSCTSCHSGYTLAGGKCNPKCTENQKWDPNTNKCITGDCPAGTFAEKRDDFHVCKPCDSSCLTCYSSTKFTCLTCSGGKLLSVHGTCVTSCEPQTFKANNTHCTRCMHENCADCKKSDSGFCTNCLNSSFVLNTTTGKCSEKCTGNKVLDPNTGSCKYCTFGCETCFGPNEKQCTKCSMNNNNFTNLPTYYLYNGTCHTRCPNDTKPLPNTNVCTNCPDNCKKCDTNGICEVCEDKFFLVAGSCLAGCNETGVYRIDETKCGLCDTGCSECKGPDECEDCLVGYYMERDGHCEEGEERKTAFITVFITLGIALIIPCMIVKSMNTSDAMKRNNIKELYAKVEAIPTDQEQVPQAAPAGRPRMPGANGLLPGVNIYGGGFQPVGYGGVPQNNGPQPQEVLPEIQQIDNPYRRGASRPDTADKMQKARANNRNILGRERPPRNDYQTAEQILNDPDNLKNDQESEIMKRQGSSKMAGPFAPVRPTSGYKAPFQRIPSRPVSRAQSRSGTRGRPKSTKLRKLEDGVDLGNVQDVAMKKAPSMREKQPEVQVQSLDVEAEREAEYSGEEEQDDQFEDIFVSEEEEDQGQYDFEGAEGNMDYPYNSQQEE